ncbi:hypothetical protein LINPERHAP1_LOCUS5754 [Linum perenne]
MHVKDNCQNLMEVQREEDGILDSSLISSTMKEEEEKLALSREKEVKADSEQAYSDTALHRVFTREDG